MLCEIKKALRLYPQKIDYHLKDLEAKGVVVRNGGYSVQPFVQDNKIEEMIGFLFSGLLQQKGISEHTQNEQNAINNSIQIVLESFSQEARKIIR